MDAPVRPRVRLTAIAEWLIAAAFLLTTLAVASLVVRELRQIEATPAASSSALEPVEGSVAVSTPPGVPERAVSVPRLPLTDGREIKVGDTFSAVSARLGRAAEVGTQEVDRGRLGERLTRFYECEGTRFILVFEPLEPQGEPKVAAIYLK